ncbi:MAG TPA: hypothetical protein VMS43_05600 [Allosphingosinicella sp.]|nr:hypothetical protein [Allosphingosinicella sp.]
MRAGRGELLRRAGADRLRADGRGGGGISTNALYARRENHPEFAERWDEIVARAGQQLAGLLQSAAVASLGPEGGAGGGGKRRGRARLPKVNVDQAIRIRLIKGLGGTGPGGTGAGGPGGRGIRPKVATNAEVKEALAKSLDAFRDRVRARHAAEGWTETAEGHLIPPGWIYVGTGEERGAAPGDVGTDGSGGPSGQWGQLASNCPRRSPWSRPAASQGDGEEARAGIARPNASCGRGAFTPSRDGTGGRAAPGGGPSLGHFRVAARARRERRAEQALVARS